MKNIQLIVNPKSGSHKGLQIMDRLLLILENDGIQFETFISEYKSHPKQLAQTIDLNHSEALLVIGGDGTMHEVINGMMTRKDKKKIPIGLIPGGTGNSLVHELDGMNPMKALNKVLAGKKRSIDLLRVDMNGESLYAFNILGWGIPAEVNILAEKLRFFGGQRYNIASFIKLFDNKSTRVKVFLDDEEIFDEFSFILACNTKYTGNGLLMAPDAEFDDGLFEVILTRKLSRFKMIALFIKLFKAQHLTDSSISLKKVRSFGITSSTKMPLNIDGQVAGHSPFRAVIIKGALEIFV